MCTCAHTSKLLANNINVKVHIILLLLGTFAVICLMVGDATSRYVDANPSLCEVVSHDNNDTMTATLDLPDCPKALEVVFTITFANGLIMLQVLVYIVAV